MTKAELIERIARSRELPTDITKKDISQVLGIAFEELAAYFAKARVTRSSSPRFTFPRFGTFTKKRRSARRGVNPRTLEPMTIDACHTIDFKASRELRESMNPSESARRSSGNTSSGKRTTKTGSRRKDSTRSTRTAAAADGALGGRRRRLTPRDEEAELDALLGDTELFDDDLPDAPVQKVRGRRGSRARTGS